MTKRTSKKILRQEYPRSDTWDRAVAVWRRERIRRGGKLNRWTR